MEEKVEFLDEGDVVLDKPISEELEEIHEEVKEEPKEEKHEEVKEEIKKEEPKKKKGKGGLIVIIVLLLLIACVALAIFVPSLLVKKSDKKPNTIDNSSKEYKSEYRMSGNGLEDFDLSFLKLENKASNKIYSPLSIKYALEMLAEGSDGDTKKQIEAVIGDYKARKYPNNEHMSFANAMFIKNTFKDQVRSEYISTLQNKYNAEVKIEQFDSAQPMNNWINEKTFKLINNLLEDEVVKQEQFILVNALAIDMKWKHLMHCSTGSSKNVPCIGNGIYSVSYTHEKLQGENNEYSKTSYPYSSEEEFPTIKFDNKDGYKSAEVLASFNKYDIIKTLGEDKIREEVGKAYKEWLETDEAKNEEKWSNYFIKDVDKYLDKYIEEINKNYGKAEISTDFSLYENESVKVFAKELQEYEGMTLEYVGIMPKNEELTNYVNNTNKEDINKLINNLKEAKIENFKEGVATIISGKIPFFDYEYELKLMDDLKSLGIKDVFEQNKANLSKMVNDKDIYIGEASHKAKIQFTNEGIKAAAASTMGGYGSSTGGFNYLYEIPTERIDVTFDKPYMYLIRDKATGEVWFTGTVYEPTKK